MRDNSELLKKNHPISQLKLFGFKRYFSEILNLYKLNKLPRVIMLNGPSGSGKTTLIFHLVNYILSMDENNRYSLTNYEISAKNRSYNLVSNSIHPNFFYLENDVSKTNIGINQVRNLIKYLGKTTYQNNLKLILIRNCEKLNKNAVNAILKSLEDIN